MPLRFKCKLFAPLPIMSWMPQNIQKRLLLYVLQQLSVFLDLDLPNLEQVSLNTIHLKDVAIDCDKVQIPGFRLRYGKAASVELSGGVMGGVNVDIDGVELVVAPCFDDILESLLFLLTQSTAEMETTMKLERELEQAVDGDENRKLPFTGVFSRALEIALLRLQINIGSIVVKVVSDTTDIQFEVEKVTFETTNGLRHASVSNIVVVGLRPDVTAGETAPSEAPSPDSDSYGEESLMDSMVFTHDEASMYMSAVSQAFDQPKNYPVLAHIDLVEVSFEGLAKVTNLCIDVGNVHVAAVPLCPILASFLDILNRHLKQKSYQVRKRNYKNGSFPQYDEDDSIDESEGSPFSKLHVDSLVVSTTSALTKAGVFASTNHLRFSATNINIKQKSDSLMYGGVEGFSITNGESVFSFDSSDKADIRFELFDSELREFTLLVSKPANIHLDAGSAGVLANFLSSVLSIALALSLANQTYQALREAQGRPKPTKTKKTQVVVQTASWTFHLHLLPVVILKVVVFPIAFNLLQNQLQISKISVLLAQNTTDTPVFDINNVHYLLNPSDFVSYTHRNRLQPHEHTVTAAQSLVFELVVGQVKYNIVKDLSKLLSGFWSGVAAQLVLPPAESIPQMSASVLRKPARIVSPRAKAFRFLIKSSTLTITDVSPAFGTLKVKILKVSAHFSGGDVAGFINEVSVVRNHDKKETFVGCYQQAGPQIVFQRNQTSVDVVVRNSVVEYYTYWALLFEPSGKSGQLSELPQTFATVLAKERNSSKSNRTDIRFFVYECAVGLKPGRLPSKLVATISKGNFDVTLGPAQYYVKSSLRETSLVLIDDTHTLKSTSSGHTARDYYVGLGYLAVGTIGNMHVGVTVNTDVETLRQRNIRLGITSPLARVDLKVNSDEQHLHLCADLAYTFAQTLNDLKIPVVLEDSDKFRTTTSPVDVFAEVKERFLHETEESVAELNDTLGDLNIVDEYYGESSATEASESSSQLSRVAESLSLEEDYFVGQMNGGDSRVVPVTVNVNLMKISLYLHDGYDWKVTRKTIKGAVKKIEESADAGAGADPDETAKPEPVELFKLFHVSAPDEGLLTQHINNEVNNDNDHEAQTYKDLRLRRSKNHKVAVELRGIEVTVNVLSTRDPLKESLDEPFEVVNTVDLKVDSVDIIDNVPTSTWNKFLTYMSQLGDRDIGSSMLKVLMVNVRPDVTLVATEAIVDVKVLPLRLHVDQDTLEFVIRFTQFRDVRFDLPIDEVLYMQKISMGPLKLRLDYKPKKIDYAGIRSGNHAELINLFILDGLTLDLRPVTLYGVDGFPKLGTELGRVWSPDIQRTQLAGLLSGLLPIRLFVNIGGGVKDLVAIPVKEYRKDGQLMRVLQKGAKTFAKTTGYEILRLGVKLASGTQVMLEHGEEFFGGEGLSARMQKPSKEEPRQKQSAVPTGKPDLLASSQLLVRQVGPADLGKPYSYVELDEDLDEHILGSSALLIEDDGEVTDEEAKLVSLYSNQPESAKEGLVSAYKAIGKNLTTTKKTLVNLKRDLEHTPTLQEQVYKVVRLSPVLLIRPIIGTTEAVLKTLMGLSNEIDHSHVAEARDKYGDESPPR